MAKFNEPYYAYRFNGVVDDPKAVVKAVWDRKFKITNEDQLLNFVIENVVDWPELRVVDGGDSCVYHVVNQELLFPKPDRLSGVKLMWNAAQKQFLPEYEVAI